LRLAGRKLISEIASVPRIEDERDDILAKKARRLQAIGVAPDDDRIDEIEAVLNVGEIQPVIRRLVRRFAPSQTLPTRYMYRRKATDARGCAAGSVGFAVHGRRDVTDRQSRRRLTLLAERLCGLPNLIAVARYLTSHIRWERNAALKAGNRLSG